MFFAKNNKKRAALFFFSPHLERYQVTTPRRTIFDVLKDETVGEEIMEDSVADALRQGKLMFQELQEIVEEVGTPWAHRVFERIKG